jgi:uncharacterized protein
MTSDTQPAGPRHVRSTRESTITARTPGGAGLASSVTTTGAVVFVVATIAVHLFRMDLNPLRDPVSLYALGEGGWLQSVALIAVGLAGLSVVGSSGGLSVFGRTSLALWAAGSLAAAAFRMDAPGVPATTAGAVHEWTGLNFVLGVVAALLFARTLRRAGRRDIWAWRARVSAWLLTASGISLVVFMGALRGLEVGGLAQRVYWLVFLAWLISVQMAVAAGPDPGIDRPLAGHGRSGELSVSIRPPVRQPPRPPSLLQRHPVLIFFALNYAVSWALWAPLAVLRGDLPAALGFVLLLLGSLVPSTVAIVLVGVLHGGAGVRRLLGRLLLWRVGYRWWLVVLVVPILVPCAIAVSLLFGGRYPAVELGIPMVLSMFVFSIFPGSALGEEIGWRGFVLPHLQARHSALGASIVLGVVWGMWHLPLWLTGAASHPLGLFPAFVVAVVASSVLYTWLYNNTRGSLLIVVLFHATTNLPLSLFPDALVSGAVPPLLIFAAMMVITAAVVAVASGPANLSRHHRRLVADH